MKFNLANFDRSRWMTAALLIVGSANASYGKQTLTELSVKVPDLLLNSSSVGKPSPSQVLHLNVAIRPGNPQGLEAYAKSVSDPKSANFRRFLTPSQVGECFGVGTPALQSVVGYLKQAGFKVKLVADNRLNIMADATVAQAEKAFHTEINLYHSKAAADAGHSNFYSFSSPLEVPQSLASKILSVSGLENHTRPVPAFRGRRQSGGTALTPSQTSLLYDLAPLHTSNYYGQGRSVAISNFDGFSVSFAQSFINTYGLPVPNGGAGSNITVETIDGGSMNGINNGEGDLDIQMVLGQAPLCNLIVYDGNGSTIDVLTQEAQDNTADIVTESYGEPVGTDFTTEHNLHLALTAQGITFVCAAGDQGANDQNLPYPDCEPEATVVGGSVATESNSGARSSEVAWSDGGGGWMTLSAPFNVLPTWQTGNGVLTNDNFRLFPDLSLVAAGTNDTNDLGAYWFYSTSGVQAGDGTSFGSPILAGSLAVVEQELITQGELATYPTSHPRLGRINDVLYGLNGQSSAIYDITSGSNGYLPDGTESNAGSGWDPASGLGAPDFQGLANAIALPEPGVSSLTLAPNSVAGGLGATGTVTLQSAAGPAGVTISLWSQVPSYVSLPASVYIGSGATTATFSISTLPFRSNYTCLIKATDKAASRSATLNVVGEAISSIVLSPSTVEGGTSSTGTISLLNPAPTGGWTVNLTSQIPTYVGVPSSITIPAGSSTGTFTITTDIFRQTYTNLITATDRTSTKSATLTVTGNSISSLTLSPTTVFGGNSSVGTITLLTPAPTGGWTVNLTSQIPTYVGVPSSITIPAGSSQGTFTITTKIFRQNYSNVITATDAASTKTATLNVEGESISTLTLSPTTLPGGASSTGTVTLLYPAPTGGWTVNLSSQIPTYVGVPASITIAAGATTGNFTITTKPFRQPYTNTITATDLTSTKSATLTVTGDSVSSLTLSPTSVEGGNSSTGTVTLLAPAPSGGWTVNLVSQIPDYVGVPASITIAAGSTTGTFTITTKSFRQTYTNTITASDAASSKTATLTVTVG